MFCKLTTYDKVTTVTTAATLDISTDEATILVAALTHVINHYECDRANFNSPPGEKYVKAVRMRDHLREVK